MDFWTRLIGRGLTSSRSRKNAPGERLTRFKHISHSLEQLNRSSTPLNPDSPATQHLRISLRRLNALLSDESRAPAPHPCHAFAASSQLYITITHLALASCDPDVLSSAAQLFNTLIEAEVDGVIDDKQFARCVIDLVRRAGYAGEEGEGRLVELVFGVANNVRLRPGILDAWFAPKPSVDATGNSEGGESEFAGATRKDDFPLFYLLVDYVHREGRTGDFARTGVLYIIETASRSRDLEKWLIESDLATLMATGLGAQYSQLSRSSVAAVEGEVPYIVALSDHAHLPIAIQPESEEHMSAFLTYLLFWQDAIDYCKSTEVNDTLLDHFQVLFLEQLLYPSLLESSDVDGGSTSAVTMYLAQILEAIDQPALVHRLLHYLLASPSGNEAHAHIESLDKDSPMYSSRRKSLDVLALLAEAAPKPSPTLFSLVDLVLVSLRSNNVQTVVATLRLISVILQRHRSFATLLFKPDQLGTTDRKRTLGEFNTEIQTIVGIATKIISDPAVDNSYESYLASASIMIEPPNFFDGTGSVPALLRADDSILTGLMDQMARFFSNPVSTNLALTGVLTSLAACVEVSVDGWVLVHPDKYQYQSLVDTEEAGEGEEKAPSATEQPEWPPSADNTPILMSTLSKLLKQLDSFRAEISNFDILLAARRDLLITEGQDPLNDELAAKLSQSRGSAVGSSSGTSTPRGRTVSGATVTAASILERIGANVSPRAASTIRSKSRATTIASQASSRPQSRARPEQVTKDLTRKLIVNVDEESERTSSTDGDASAHATGETNIADEAESHPGSTEADASTETNADPNGTAPNGASKDDENEDDNGVTLGHILTNAVILYEFILELSAILQVRAGVLDEVSFTTTR